MDSEKQMFMNTWNKEYGTTLKVLKAYPQERGEYRPHEKSKSARELAWVFVSEDQMIMGGLKKGKFEFDKMPKAPATMKEVISELEKWHAQAKKELDSMTEAQLNEKMEFFVAPKKMAPVRKMDLLWMFLMDQIHHRGQFSVYIRLAGGKVPSIYGPSADEPWM